MCTTGELGLRVQFASWTGFKEILSGRQMEVSIMNARNLMKMLAAVLIAGMVASPMVLAKGPLGGSSGGSGSGGRPGEETAAQNLSVPAILVGPLGTLVCGADDQNPSALVPPTGTPLTGYEVAGYYWVQKVHTWKAQCFNASYASVFGAWGDNLAGDAKLSTGSPIRVEIVLTNTDDFTATGSNTVPSGTLQGYKVIKLQPSTLDRLSAYGHLAGGDEVSDWTDIPAYFPQYPTNETCPEPTDTTNPGCQGWVVHDAGMQISVENLDTGEFVVPLQPIAPEINATGKIVYGYNLRVSAAGKYQIRFASTPAVTFTGTDVPNDNNDSNNAYLDIDVIPGGGGGGGNNAGGNGNGPNR